MKKAIVLTLITLLLGSMSVAMFAQGAPAAKAPAPEKKAAPKADKAYICEMGCEVAAKPGKCSKCGMNLKEVNKSDIQYTCDMCKVTNEKGGKCPKCGMEMKAGLKPAPAAKNAGSAKKP